MKHLAILVLAGAASAFAQTSTDRQGVTTSTDPAKAKQVEQHAQELQKDQAPASAPMKSKAHKRHHRAHMASKAASAP